MLSLKVRVGACVQLRSPGEAPYAATFLLSAVRRRLLGLCTSCWGWGRASPRSQLCRNPSTLPQVQFLALPTAAVLLVLLRNFSHLRSLGALVGFHKCLCDRGTLDPHTCYQESTGEPGTERRHALHNFCSGLNASEGSW